MLTQQVITETKQNYIGNEKKKVFEGDGRTQKTTKTVVVRLPFTSDNTVKERATQKATFETGLQIENI